jgi:hypothetical protein
MRAILTKALLLRVALVLAADIAASAAVWSGTPTDWPWPPPRFWISESSRLVYWCIFSLPCVSVWVITRARVAHRLAGLIVDAVAIFCLLGTEILTSIFFWRTLDWMKGAGLGHPTLREYAREHSIFWVAALLLCITLQYLWSKRKRQVTAA